MNLHVFMESTEEGKKLELSFEQEHNCKLVYKKADDENQHVFAGAWNPETEYSDDHIIVPFRSAFKGIFHYSQGDEFANVIGSTHDPKPVNPQTQSRFRYWTDLLKFCNIDCSNCVTDGNFYDSEDEDVLVGPAYHCSHNIVGGHVIEGQDASTVWPGSGGVYIIPICSNHNRARSQSWQDFGDGYYMKMGNDGYGIELKNFLKY